MKRIFMGMALLTISLCCKTYAVTFADEQSLVNNVEPQINMAGDGISDSPNSIANSSALNLFRAYSAKKVATYSPTATDNSGNSGIIKKIRLFSNSKIGSTFSNSIGGIGTNVKSGTNNIASGNTTILFAAKNLGGEPLGGSDIDDGPGNGTLPPPPGYVDPDKQLPLNDAILPMLLMIGIYAIVRKNKLNCSNKHIN